MITMFIDHFGLLFYPEVDAFRIIGRIAFPIYAYLISEGCKYTHNRKRYLLQILILGLVCSIAYSIEEGVLFFCILSTFSISIVLIYLYDYCIKDSRNKSILFFLALILVYILCHYVEFDYGFFGILVPLLVYMGKTKRIKLVLLAIGLILLILNAGYSLQVYCILSIPFIMMYNGTRGKLRLKWIFYIFYPTHLILLWVVYTIVRT